MRCLPNVISHVSSCTDDTKLNILTLGIHWQYVTHVFSYAHRLHFIIFLISRPRSLQLRKRHTIPARTPEHLHLHMQSGYAQLKQVQSTAMPATRSRRWRARYDMVLSLFHTLDMLSELMPEARSGSFWCDGH